MATLITCKPAGYRTIAPPNGAHAFTVADLVGLLGGACRVIVLRGHGNADEVLIVRRDADALPLNAIADALTVDAPSAKAPRAAPVRGDAIHCMRVHDEGTIEYV